MADLESPQVNSKVAVDDVLHCATAPQERTLTMKRPETQRPTVWYLGVALILSAFVILALGFANQYLGYSLGETLDGLIGDLYSNVAMELVSIAITVLIVDSLYERARTRQLKEQLIRQLGSSVDIIAINAMDELRALGWLTDRTLVGQSFARAKWHGANLEYSNLESASVVDALLSEANLKWANLHRADMRHAFCEDAHFVGTDFSGAQLRGANLRGAYLINANFQNADMRETNLNNAVLWGANLQSAWVTDEQLAKAIMLTDAVLPDGTRYDGRYALSGDLALSSDARAPKVPLYTAAQQRPPDEQVMVEQFMCWKWVEERILGHSIYYTPADVLNVSR